MKRQRRARMSHTSSPVLKRSESLGLKMDYSHKMEQNRMEAPNPKPTPLYLHTPHPSPPNLPPPPKPPAWKMSTEVSCDAA